MLKLKITSLIIGGIPSKCPKCGETKAWKEEINPVTSGIPAGAGRIRFFVIKGLFAKPVQRALGFRKVSYKCHNCGFRERRGGPE